MRPEFKKYLDGFLLEGDEDYIGLWEIVSDVSTILKIEEMSLNISDADRLWKGVQEFVILMLESGFEAVYLAAEGKCEAWPDQSPAGVIAKIKNLWIKNKGDIQHSVWFNKISKNRRQP